MHSAKIANTYISTANHFFLNRWRHILTDIRFWIVLFFVLRLYHITNPPLEVVHNWRQTTVVMPVRNWVEEGLDLLHPKVDFAGEKTGITGMEFPLLNYLIYLASWLFGYDHWYGRLINLAVSSAGLWYFYMLVKKYFGEQLAFHATFILLFSIWFSYSRKIMPDTFSVSLVVAGMYYGSNYLDAKANFKNLVLYFLLALAGVLSKLPAGCLLIVFALFILDKKILLQRRILFSLASAAVISLVSAYYFYWVPYLTDTYGFEHFFMGKSVGNGFADILAHYDRALEKFYSQGLGYTGFLIFLYGLILLFRKKEKRLVLVVALLSLAFLIIVLKAGATFCNHSYYMMPYAPVMALVAAYASTSLQNKKAAVALLALVAIECIARNNADFYIKEENFALLSLEADLDRVSRRSDRILINSNYVPTPTYFAHRKGWAEDNNSAASSEHIAALKAKGLKYIVILKRAFGEPLALSYPKVFENNDICIYKP